MIYAINLGTSIHHPGDNIFYTEKKLVRLGLKTVAGLRLL
jgi:hypothetical protein